MSMVESRQSVQSLAQTIHSLLGLKAHLTSNWVKSVRDIIKSLPSEKSSDNIQPKNEDVNSEIAITKIKEELAVLTAHINQLNVQRRQVLNELLDLKGNIRVFCRIRPITIGENFGRLRPVVTSDLSTVLLKLDENKSKSYSFDKVFHPSSSQDEVFSEVEPVVKSVLDGYNACIFAYGQTGTGKTFTMEGTPDSQGIVPRALEALFKQAVESNHGFLISFSMLEVYLGNLKDLLVPHPTKPTDPMPPCLSIHTDSKGGIEIDNLVAIQVSDFHQALRLYRFGCRFRSTASTNSNSTSSRSHCMIRISITCSDAPERRREKNKVWLVDLGGSERMLKTKAWGRRLQEGNAINLSLSALGDVINSLQRRKQHIPYRNSKLTQVLKDSLGEDSKTLMLVHVSPKEEDLCETICSLNFATRVKSIHLGHEDPKEIRDKKESLMKNLQQKMKKIEEERQQVRGEIEKLNLKLENLTRPTQSIGEQLETSYSGIEDPVANLGVKKNDNEDVTAASSSKLPRFMRATVSSRTKSGTNLHTSEGKDQVVRRRRRPSYQRAESVTFPVKNNSDYKSEHSISRSSCLAGLNMKSSADNETECSQETLEYVSKVNTFLEKSKSQRTQVRQTVPSIKKSGSQNSTKYSKVQEWLSRRNEPSISGYSNRNKRIQAIPILEKKQRSGPLKGGKPHQNVINCNQTETRLDVRNDELLISEVIIEKPQTTLKELFEHETSSDSSSPSDAISGHIVLETHDFSGESSIEDNASYTSSQHEMSYCSVDYCEGHCENMRNVGYQLSPSRSISGINSRERLGTFDSILELDFHDLRVPTDTSMKEYDNKDLDHHFQSSLELTRPSPLRLESQRALFMDKANQKDLTMQHDMSEKRTQIKGVSHGLNQKVQTLFTSALLGLGFYDLGFDSDFFYALML